MLGKKKMIALALVMFLLLASCGVSPAEGGETEPPSPPPSTSAPAGGAEPPQEDAPAYYAAYADIVQEYRQQYGPERIQQINSPVEEMNYLMGLCVVRLIDFDLDGTLELMLCWPESEEAYHSYRYAIWTSPDGKAVERICESQIFDGAMSYCPFIQLVERTDGTYLGEDAVIPDADEAHIYRKVSASGLSEALTLGYTPPFGVEEQYLVNGEAVSADTYTQTESDFLDGAQTEQITFAFPTFEDPARLAEQIQATQTALTLLGIDPSENVIEGAGNISVSNGSAGYSPYVELIDQYLREYGQPQIMPSSRWDGNDDVPALGGLCVVRTADMNGDGTEELILAYAQSVAADGNHISYTYGIWTLRDGAAQELICASTPGAAYELCMMLYAGLAENYMAVNYDTNTEQAASIANVDYEVRCYGYDGEKLIQMDSLAGLSDEIRNNETERIYFSANSYRWAAGMDWDEDSQRVLSKTLETIDLLRSSSN